MEHRLIRLAAVFKSLQSPVSGPCFTEGQLRHRAICPSVPKASHRQCWAWGPGSLAQWLKVGKGAGPVTCQCNSSLLASSSSSVPALCWIQGLSPSLILFPSPSCSPSPCSPFSALFISHPFYVSSLFLLLLSPSFSLPPPTVSLIHLMPFPCLVPYLPSRHPPHLSLSVPLFCHPTLVARAGWLPAQDWKGLSYEGPMGPDGGAEEMLWVARGCLPACLPHRLSMSCEKDPGACCQMPSLGRG